MNRPNKSYYYIASPGFNEDQLRVIKFIETSLEDQHMDFFSPFTHGGKLKLEPDLEYTKIRVKVMFDENIDQLNQATHLIAVTDGLDKGTLFEIGYFIGKRVHEDCPWHDKVQLFGENSDEVSAMITDLIKKLKERIKNKSHVVVDISEKTSDVYVYMGLLYANQASIITWSDKPLNSNLMTACCTRYHCDASEMSKHIETVYGNAYDISTVEATQEFIDKWGTDIFKGQQSTLTALRVSKKIE